MPKQPRSVDALVREQVQRWAAGTGRRDAGAGLYWPVITISRAYGARGAELAGAVCDELGFTCWDKQLVHEIAEHSSVSESLFGSVDEHRKSAIATFIDTFVQQQTITDSDYLRRLVRFVRTIADHGRSVIVGRGAQFILDPADVLRVRVVCPEDDRVSRLVARRGVTPVAARAELVRVDRQRREFVRYHYDQDVDDANAYDLILNTGTMRGDKAMQVVLAAYRTKWDEVPLRKHAFARLSAHI